MVGHSELSTRKPGSYEHTDHNYSGIPHDGDTDHPNAHRGSKGPHGPDVAHEGKSKKSEKRTGTKKGAREKTPHEESEKGMHEEHDDSAY